MGNMVFPYGPTTLLSISSGATAANGDWFRIHPKSRNIGFQVRLDASSAGATAGCTVYIDVSNDGRTPLSYMIIALTNTTTDYAAAGGTFSSTQAPQWAYCRARLISCTTSTAGSAGSPTVEVFANAAQGG